MSDVILDIVKKYWGYESFRPHQQEAIECILEKRDSVVILPTGGGKSLCYQVPAMCTEGMAIVISPLISLMKDQVDALIECGVTAARLDSTLDRQTQYEVHQSIERDVLKILYLSPERLLSGNFLEFIKDKKVSFIAIDEAHCVSSWGHDFRPEYHRLSILKKIFPDISVHGFTATATTVVQDDIATQLHLQNPKVLIGSYDRPNLSYKVAQREKILDQVIDVIDRHQNESGIIYCIRRTDVDELSTSLRKRGIRVRPYHAGMSSDERQKNQDEFITEKCDIVVATIAFGMGIDKSNVRYVIHTGMPKSLENYQQESGRAGRDGLEAECCLFYSAGDYGVWKSIMRDLSDTALEAGMKQLNGIYGFTRGYACRHRAIIEYFDQAFEKDNCGACDVCLGDVDYLDAPLEICQKMISCVARLGEYFGTVYTALVLVGSKDKKVIGNQHDLITTYGMLSEYDRRTVCDWIEQLVVQKFLVKAGEFNVINITESGWEVLRGNITPKLIKPSQKKKVVKVRVAKAYGESWKGVHQELFEALRDLRRNLASEKKIPAYVVFGDNTLRDMARRRPNKKEGFLEVSGVGEKKNKKYGKVFMSLIDTYCSKNEIDMNV